MAEALGKVFANDVFESYSGGTETKDSINKDATRIIKELYGVDMSISQKPKLLSEIPNIDIATKMGCNVNCPFLPASHIEDWGLDDPTEKDDYEFIKTAKTIEFKIKDLAERIKNNSI